MAEQKITHLTHTQKGEQFTSALNSLLQNQNIINARAINLLKPIDCMMHQQVLTSNNCTLCPRCIYVFCIYLRTISDLCPMHHKLIGFYNRDEKCLQRGINEVFK
jgi:ferredoxin